MVSLKKQKKKKKDCKKFFYSSNAFIHMPLEIFRTSFALKGVFLFFGKKYKKPEFYTQVFLYKYVISLILGS
ncbi:hypothetical protein B5C39_00745 [Mesomycoplasma hyopneumoniae]|nr:hypothetical protein B5C39_00745 [Mesomycoplasma hyopneumoniae]